MNHDLVKFNPREIESGLYWIFGYREEIDGDVDDYGRSIARRTGCKEKVKSIAYIEVYDNGEFELEKLPSLIRLVDGDDFDVLDFVPSFVIPISLESPTEIPNS